MPLHLDLNPGDIHKIHNFEYADTAARTGASVTSDDVGKVAVQLDNNTYWVLIDTVPTWTQITNEAGGGGSVAQPSGFVAGDGYLAFFVGDNVIAGDNDMYWDRATHSLALSSDATVAINTTPGSAILEVNDRPSAIGSIINVYADDGSPWLMQLFRSDLTDAVQQYWIDNSGNAQIRNKHATGNLQFHFNNSNPSMTLTQSHALGIGLSITPVNTLDVNGGAVIGSSYAGSQVAPSDALLVQSGIGINTTSLSMVSGTALLSMNSGAGQAGMVINNTAATGDPVIQYQLSGSAIYTMGVDDSDSDKFKIGTSALATGTLFTMTTGGDIGIGTITPQNKLDIEGSVAIGATFSGTNAAPTNGMIIEGDVGIGAVPSSSARRLTVYKNLDEANELILWADNTGSTTEARHRVRTPANSLWMKSHSASRTGSLAGVDLDNSVAIYTTDASRMLVGSTNSAPIYLFANSTPTMTIDDGRVGILTTSPIEPLTINGPIALQELGATPATEDGYGKVWVDASGELNFVDDDGNNVLITSGGSVNAAGGGGISATQGSDGYLAFFTGSDSIAGDNDLFWDRENNKLIVGGNATATIYNGLDVIGRRTESAEPAGAITTTTYYEGNDGSQINLRHARGIETSASTLDSNDMMGQIQFYGYDGSNFGLGARIIAQTDGTISSGVVPGELRYYLTDTGGTNQWLFQMNHTGHFWLAETTSTTTPDSGFGALYVNTSGQLWFKNDGGAATQITGIGGLVNGTGSSGHIAYWSGTDSITYDSGDFYWDASGNALGINTTSPGANIHINTSTPNIRLEDTTGGTDTFQIQNLNGVYQILNITDSSRVDFHVDGDGRVGIGTDSPGQTLDVSKSQDSGTVIRAENSNTGTGAFARLQAAADSASLIINTYSAASTSGEILAGLASRAKSVQFLVQNADNIGFSANQNGRFLFVNNSYLTASMTNEGNLGVGTLFPQERLTVNGAIALQSMASLNSDLDIDGYGRIYVNDDEKLYFRDKDGIEFDLTSGGGGVTATEGSDGYVAFFTGANSIAGDNDLFWDRANNSLGIGTTSPGRVLEVRKDYDGNAGIQSYNQDAGTGAHASFTARAINAGATDGSRLYVVAFGENYNLFTVDGEALASAVWIAADAFTSKMLIGCDTASPVHLYTGGQIGLTVDSSQNVIVGRTTASTGAKFEVYGSTNDGSEDIFVNNFAPGLRLIDRSSGADDFRLGIDDGIFKISIDTDDDGNQDADGHFDDNPNALTIVGSSGNVGIGVASAVNKLDVEGAAVIGSSYSGSNTAPSNGMLIQGNVSIGTTSNANTLDVEGGVAIGSSYSGSTVAPTDGLIVEGQVGIGTDNPDSGVPLHVVGSFGRMLVQDNQTNNTTKIARIGTGHFVNTEQPAAGIVIVGQEGDNRLNLGGGTSIFNATTTMVFYTAENAATTTGTPRMVINSEGHVGIGGTFLAHEALTINGILSLEEQDNYDRTHDGYGSIWAKSDNNLQYTNDQGITTQITQEDGYVNWTPSWINVIVKSADTGGDANEHTIPTDASFGAPMTATITGRGIYFQTQNGQFNVTKSGVYRFSAQIPWEDSDTDTGNIDFRVKRNGTIAEWLFTERWSNSLDVSPKTTVIDFLVELDAGDTLEITWNPRNSAALINPKGSWFTINMQQVSVE